jgi:hypothetical protein
MKITALKAYDVFKTTFGEKDAEVVFEYFEDKINEKQVDDRLKDFKEIFATKEDISKLEIKLTDNKSEMLKWMFIIWATQLLAMFAFLKFFIK